MLIHYLILPRGVIAMLENHSAAITHMLSVSQTIQCVVLIGPALNTVYNIILLTVRVLIVFSILFHTIQK